MGHERPFYTDCPSAELKNRSVQGGVVTVGAQAAKFFLQLGATVVLARLLVPESFGLVAMVTAVTGLMAVFKDAGLSMATVQRDKIDHQQLSTLFWINVALGAVLAASVASLAPALAWLYGRPELMPITLALASTFLLGGASAQPQALLQRQMRFPLLAVIGVVSSAAGVAVGIATAILGGGYWALVCIPVVSALVNAISVWGASGWRPGLPSRRSGVRAMLHFGGHLTAGNVLNYGCRNLDNVLLGVTWGAVPLGLYSKAYQLLLLPITQINAPLSAVMIPALSRLQNEPVRYRAAYCKAMSFVATMGMPAVVATAVLAPDLVLAVLGSQWLAAVPIFLALAPAAFVGTLNVSSGWIFVPSGRTDRQLRCTFIGSAVTILAFIAGLPWGALGMAIAYSGATVAMRPLQLAYACHGSPVRMRDLGAAIVRPATASLLAGVALETIARLPHWPDVLPWRIAAGIGIYTIFYLFLSALLPGGKKWFADTVALSRAFRPAVSPPGASSSLAPVSARKASCELNLPS
ncbi:MAG: lipopolysaccharide biosynthesis protein [Pirellulales bacterium]|nr:lipopolysaccharide biosynthesis protein [Pirellulales bacterium]